MATKIEEYCEREGFRIATMIEDRMAIIVKPKPWYCPGWLYKKIIHDSVEMINLTK